MTENSSTTATQSAKILALLRTHGSVTSVELNKVAYRYSARFHELRQDGHQIQTIRDHPSPRVSTYLYLARPARHNEE